MPVNMKTSLVLLWAVYALLSVESHSALLPEGSANESHYQNPHTEPTPSRTTTTIQNTVVMSSMHSHTSDPRPTGTSTVALNREGAMGMPNGTSTVVLNGEGAMGMPNGTSTVALNREGAMGMPTGTSTVALNREGAMGMPNGTSTGNSHSLHTPTPVSTVPPVTVSGPKNTGQPDSPSVEPSTSSSLPPHSPSEPVANIPTGTSLPSNQPSPTDSGTHMKRPSPATTSGHTTKPSSSQTVHSATETVISPKPSTSAPQNSVTDHSTSSRPVGHSEPQSPTRPATPPTTPLSSTTGKNSHTESALTTEVKTPTTINSTNSSIGVLIPQDPKGKDPPSEPGVQSCPTTTVWGGMVSQCLIAITTLSGVATVFMVSTVILCAKLSARKHLYRVRQVNPGTEMVCISTLLPERSNKYERQRNPRSNGALIPIMGDDSDEDGGDTLTLNSFLPDNDRAV